LEVGNLVDLLDDPAGQHPDDLAAVSGKLRLSSAELSHREVHTEIASQSREAQHLRAMLTGDELMEFCRDHLAVYEAPGLVRSVEALPITGSGSIRRQALDQVVDLEPTTT